MGRDGDTMAVLNGKSRAKVTKVLRVVDTSVFPRIPAWFIVTAVDTVSENAAGVILKDVV